MLWAKAIVVTIGNGIKSGNHGSILFQGDDFNQILCIESSGLKILGGKDFSNSFIASGFTPGDNLIAIKVKIMDNKGRSIVKEMAFLLGIKSEDGKLSINENENFLSFGNNRLGSIDDNGYIAMQIDKDIFTTNPKHEGPHYLISEKNVCCKYIAGRIEADEVTRSAEFTEAAKKAQQGKELELQKEIYALKANLEKQKTDFQAKYEKSKKETSKAWEELGEWRKLVDEIKGIIKPGPYYNGDLNIIERIVKWFTFRKNLRAIIEESPLLNKKGGMGDI